MILYKSNLALKPTNPLMCELYLKKYMLSNYDEMEIEGKTIHTNNFTENMELFEEIRDCHPFIIYLIGFSHNLYDSCSKCDADIPKIHGWCHKETRNSKFFIHHSAADLANMIYVAWNKYCALFHKIRPLNIEFYGNYCGSLYNTNNNEHDLGEKLFYTAFARDIITHLAKIE